MENRKMKVEIWSDMVCPFCYIGKRHYEAALSKFAHANDIETEWHSFQLNPDLPADTHQNPYQYLAKAKGISYEQSVKMHEHVTGMAHNAGLTYNFDKAVIVNSFNAHRLLQMAKKHKLGSKAEEVLFKAYFTDGRNLNDVETLVQLGTDIGLKPEDIRSMLAGDTNTAEVHADLREAEQIGINGVPFFVFNRKYGVSGAQPADTFLNTLQHAWDEWAKTNR